MEYCPEDGMKLRPVVEQEIDPLIGTTLDGRWRIEEKIDDGGMGNVYSGHQTSVNRRVAIKTLRSELTKNEEFADRFFREAEMATKISHPNCVTVLDFGQSESGTLYLAMEYLDGEPLTKRINHGEVSVEEVYKIGIQIASALMAAHGKKIVHRDLKPDNIFLLNMPNNEIFVKVLDFGIAKALDSEAEVTKAGMIFGTPDYMSPEQCRGTHVDGRSDLYGVGCILYELLGGRPPFAAKTPMAILLSHVNDEVAPLQSVASSTIPMGLTQIVMQLLEKEPADRFDSAKVLHSKLESELERFLHPEKFRDNEAEKQSSRIISPIVRNEENIVNPAPQPVVAKVTPNQGLNQILDLSGTREQARLVLPKRSKAPFLFAFVVVAALIYGVYYLLKPGPLPIVEPEISIDTSKENKPEEETIKSVQVPEEKQVETPIAIGKSKKKIRKTKGRKKSASTMKKPLKKKKILIKKAVLPNHVEQNKGSKETKHNEMPDPNGPIVLPPKPVKAKPDPLPGTLSSPIKKALKGLKRDNLEHGIDDKRIKLD